MFFLKYFPDFLENSFYILYDRKFDAVVMESMGFGSLPPFILDRLEQFKEINTEALVIAEHDSPLRTFPLDADTMYESFPHVSLIKNMTVTATLVKTAFILQNFPNIFKNKMKENFCGDIVR